MCHPERVHILSSTNTNKRGLYSQLFPLFRERKSREGGEGREKRNERDEGRNVASPSVVRAGETENPLSMEANKSRRQSRDGDKGKEWAETGQPRG